MNFKNMLTPPRKNTMFKLDNHYVWDGSITQDNKGKYHLFASCWHKKNSFYGWLTDSSIIRAESDNIDGPYIFKEELDVLKNQSWCKHMVHNPVVHKINDTYYMFHIGTHWGNANPDKVRFAPVHWWNTKNKDANEIRFNQRIGLAKAKHPAGPWETLGKILEPRPEMWDRCMITNPSVLVLNDGKILLVYKSTPSTGEKMQLGAAVADEPEGPYERTEPSPLFHDNVEDPFMWQGDDNYYMICRNMTEKVFNGATLLYESANALNWTCSAAPLAYDCNLEWSDGTKEQVELVDRPCIFISDTEKCLSNALWQKDKLTGIIFRKLKR